jgi:translocation and assembly module TamB
MVTKLFGTLFRNKPIKRLSIVLAVALSIAILFFFIRGPYLSNSIKRFIIPALEDLTGERIIIDKAVINPFPLYLQTRRFKVFDEKGNRLLFVRKMRAYIDLAGLFSKEIRIRRLTLKDVLLTSDRQEFDRLISHVDDSTKQKNGGNFRISLKSVKLTNGNFRLKGTKEQISTSGDGLQVEMSVRDKAYADILLKEGTLKLPGWPALKGAFEGRIEADNKKIKIARAAVSSSESSLKADGEIYLSSSGGEKLGNFKGEARIFTGTIGEIFGMKEVREGDISLAGSVDLYSGPGRKGRSPGRKVKLDLKTDGRFYLETLMALLKVKENIKGHISLDGKIQGIYPDITGKGLVKAGNLELDTLPLDDLEGTISYGDKRFTLEDFTAHTYGGELKGSANLLIPGGRYSVDAGFMNINSLQFFRFIRWEPPFPEGRISGTFTLGKSPGSDIELDAHAEYANTTENVEGLLKDRLSHIVATLNMQNGILTFSDSSLHTSVSTLFLNGTIDLRENQLNINLDLESRDARDVTLPYYTGLHAPLRFTGKAEGPAATPDISGAIEIGSGTVHGESFERAAGELLYNSELLTLNFLRGNQGESVYEISGSIAFRKSKGIFSFEDPFYRAEAVINNGDVQSALRAVYREIPLTGSMSGRIIFEGDRKTFNGKGDLVLRDGTIHGQKVDSASISANLTQEGFLFQSIKLDRGKSKIRANGSVFFDERFDAMVFSDSIHLGDIVFFEDHPVDAHFNLDLKGSGTLKEPHVTFSSHLIESSFKNVLMGSGDMKGELKNNRLSIKGDVINGNVTVDAGIVLSKDLPWDLDLELRDGRYDFLLAGFLKDVPGDLTASLEGIVRLSGKKKRFSMDSKFTTLGFSLYGYSFRNTGDIVIDLVDDELRIKSFDIRGRNGDISTSGVIRIGEHYDIRMDGRMDLTPLKAFTKKIESLKGEGIFSVSISGPWESPDFNGKIHIGEGSFMFSDFPYTVGQVNGDIFLDKEKVTIDSFQADFAGGKVSVTGFGHLKELSMKRLSLFSEMKNIKFRPVEGLNTAFDGNLFFEASPERQSITGDIKLRKAQYTKRSTPQAGQPTFLNKMDMNIYIRGEDDILIDNNIAQAAVKVALNVRGTPAQYGLIGRIEADGGTIFFRGNEFKIIDGSVDFVESGRIVPIFHVQSETFVKGYRVRLDLDGPVDKFTLSFFSDPPLADNDILTLLTSGQITSGTKGIEGGIGAGEATAFLTGRLQDVLEERFKYITGFERFEIDPRTSSKGAVSSKITVGKQMMDGKLLVTYSSSVGSTELDIIKLRYNLTDNFSLVGMRDEIGSIGADVNYRFEFK